MAMPPDTPMPCMVKLIKGGECWAGIACPLDPRSLSFVSVLFPFPKFLVDQSNQRRHGLGFVGTIGFYGDQGTLCCRQHHDAHDAFCIDFAALAGDPHFGCKPARQLSKLGRRTSVKPELVYDLNVPLLHCAPGQW